MKYLIADLANEGELKILLINKGASSQILNAFYYHFEPGAENLAAMLAARLKEQNLQHFPLYLVLPWKLVKDSIIHTPKLSIAELKKIIPREINNLTGEKTSYAYGYKIGEVFQEKQLAKMEVILFYSEYAVIVSLLEELKTFEIRPQKLLIPNEALLALVPELPFRLEEKEALAFIEVKTQKLSITIFKGANWSVSREFIYRTDFQKELTADELERIMLEVNRTFQFFRQKNRSYSLNKLVLSGSCLRPAMVDFFRENLGLQVIISDRSMFKKLIYPPTVEDDREFSALFFSSFGAHYLLQQKNHSNFLPQEFVEKEALLKRVIGWVISAAVLLGIMVPAVFFLESIKAEKRAELARLESNLAAIDANRQEIEQAKQMRAEYYRYSFFYNFPADSSYRIAEFIRQLTFITDSDIRLLQLDLKNGYSKARFRLSGEVRMADSIQAQKKFLQFFEQLGQLKGLSGLSYSDLKTVAESEVPAEQLSQKTFAPLSFVIKGELERQ